MDIVKKNENIPELPVLSSEKRDLVGLNGLLSDFGLNRLERLGRRERQKIYIGTEIQLVRDKTSAIIQAYRILIAQAEAMLTKQAEENVQDAIEKSDARISANKIWTMKKAAEDFNNFLLNIPPDMPDGVKDILVKRAAAVFERTLEKIESFEFSLGNRITGNHSEKKTLWEKLRP